MKINIAGLSKVDGVIEGPINACLKDEFADEEQIEEIRKLNDFATKKKSL